MVPSVCPYRVLRGTKTLPCHGKRKPVCTNTCRLSVAQMAPESPHISRWSSANRIDAGSAVSLASRSAVTSVAGLSTIDSGGAGKSPSSAASGGEYRITTGTLVSCQVAIRSPSDCRSMETT